jgi:hypothetical protein
MKIKSIILTLIVTFGVSWQAQAGKVLSPDEIKALITGNTVHAEHLKKGFNFSVYFNEDGSVIRKWKNDKLQDGKWFFKDNLHCINVGGGDKCASIEDNGDGSYKRLKNGKSNKHFITWKSIANGKDL